MGVNFEPSLSPSYGVLANFSGNLGFGRGLNPYYGGNSSRYSNSIGFGGGNGGSNSVLSSMARNVWGNGGLNYSSTAVNSNAFIGSGSGSIGGSSFGSNGENWGSSISTQSGGSGSGYNNANLVYGSGDGNYRLSSGGGYGRNSGTAVAPSSSFSASSGNYDGGYNDLYVSSSVYGDPTRRSAPIYGRNESQLISMFNNLRPKAVVLLIQSQDHAPTNLLLRSGTCPTLCLQHSWAVAPQGT
ncbi:hypothetical protein Syun_014933 [Stephania yunnanensis]|uniref:Uncharacterized protein n=1 Tax=Stephania yunnanensis TaxID=152371 RepID=A0AAP0JLZ6_9MAGN